MTIYIARARQWRVVVGVHYYIFPDCRVPIVFWYTHTVGIKKVKNVRHDVQLFRFALTRESIVTRECVCVCLFFILYFLPFPSDRADCGIDFGRRICAGTPRVRDKSIKLTMWLRRQIFRRTNGGDMISDLNRPRADAAGRRDIIRLRRRRREKAGKKGYSGRRRKKKIKTKCAHI